MPDFERIMRSLKLHLAKSPEEKNELIKKFHKQDKIRLRILAGVIGVIIGYVVTRLLLM